MDDEEKNRSDSFTKQQIDKGKEKLKDETKKKAKQQVLKFLIANPEVVLVLLGIIVFIIVMLILLSAFENSLGINTAWGMSKAKDAEIRVIYSTDTNDIQTNGDFLNVAKQVWDEVSKTGSKYTRYGASTVPCEGPTIDCSSYVSWVLLEYGYEDFRGAQHRTYDFKDTNWNEKYGWEEIPVSGNVINQVQAGDILVRQGGNTHHIDIIAKVENGSAYGYDCGSTSAKWVGYNGDMMNLDWFVKSDSTPGKIIRVNPSGSTLAENNTQEDDQTDDEKQFTGGTDLSRIQIENDNGRYKIKSSFTDEEMENLREFFKEDGKNDLSDTEVAILGALLEGGADFSMFTDEQIACIPYFIKAEAATQYLDLRSSGILEKNTKDSADNYKPKRLGALAEDEIPGTILVQRSNTKDNTSKVLDYMEEKEFNELYEKEKQYKTSKDLTIINYFTVDKDGQLIVVDWSSEKVDVEGEYPENLEESKKTSEVNKYILNKRKINYLSKVQKYTMPFDFLMQLLIVTEDPKFCTEVAETAIDSKIIINIQEEENETQTTETQNYLVHNKENKYIDYFVTAGEGSSITEIESQKNYFLEKTTTGDEKNGDGENKPCTNYSNKEYEVTITRTNINHTYTIEISEAETWICHYKKEYKKSKVVPNEHDDINVNEKGKYGDPERKEDTEKDSDAKEYKEEKEKFYKDKIKDIINSVSVYTTSGQVTENGEQKNYKKILISGDVASFTGFKSIYYQNDDGTYDLPGSILVRTKEKDGIPGIDLIFILSGEDSYTCITSADGLVECIIDYLRIEKFERIDYASITETNYDIDYKSNPKQPTVDLYDGIDEDNGKFLVALGNSIYAQREMASVEDWLYNMMEKNEKTVDLVNTIKYLMFCFDTKYRGVTELDKDLFNPDDFQDPNSGSGSEWWWPIGSKETETINGKLFAKGTPVVTNITSGVGPRWGTNHGGIDIPGPRNTNIIAARAGKVIKVVDGYGDGYLGCRPNGSGYANMIKIQHDDGTYSLYAHLEKGTIKVKQGDRVEQGQVIAGMGTSGNSTGVHLHFEIRNAGDKTLDPEEYVDPKNPRPVSTVTAAFTLPGRNQSYYSLTDEELKTFTAVVIGEGGTNKDSVFWTASAMFNRIDIKYYGDTDAMKILTKGWSEVYNNGSYKKHFSNKNFNDVLNIVKEVVNGKRAHKYTDFACDAPGYPLASNWIKNHPGEKYEWFKGNMYCAWKDSIK